MRKPLWTPSEERIRQANVTRFMGHVSRTRGLQITSYDQLYRWSIENIPDFWAAVREFTELQASAYETVVEDLKRFPGTRWFPGARLNFAENLLKYRDEQPAFVFRGEAGQSRAISYSELFNHVARLSAALRGAGIRPGDRVAAYMPNLPETAIAMLAATSIGAIWSSCGTELGPAAVVDRVGQIEPRVLFTVDGYFYKGKAFDVRPNIEKIAREIPALGQVIVFAYVEGQPDLSCIPHAVRHDDFIGKERDTAMQFEQLPFDHPLYIMFSSGTTGKPKCMVQSAGGVLINHLKELVLHTDLRREDRISYITSPSWMMWNWLMSSLAVGATIVLYDGNPGWPDWGAMWRLVQDERVSIFGCSASYLSWLRSSGASPGKVYDLSSLREISQTGSPLSSEGFEYVYSEIKKDLHFNSISGGTDINGCFAAGIPVQPVYAGELQGPALGMKVRAYDETGKPVIDQEGELVCEAPSPSMPLYFWGDDDGSRYRDAYFGVYPGVWRHGDWVAFHGDTGGITFLGRSDFTLKPSGVRIGSAEIYRIVENINEIADSLVVGHDRHGDQRVVLFVKMATGAQLTEEVKATIKVALRDKASPRHVPALIIEAPDIPYTFSMKKVESAVSNLLNGRAVANRESLVNPDSLVFYEKIVKVVCEE